LSFCRFLIHLRHSADRQWFVLICATVRAIEFLALSIHGFFGGGGGIARVPRSTPDPVSGCCDKYIQLDGELYTLSLYSVNSLVTPIAMSGHNWQTVE